MRELRSLELFCLEPDGVVALKDLPDLEHLKIVRISVAGDTADFSAMKSLRTLEIGRFDTVVKKLRLPENLERLKLFWREDVMLDIQPLPKRIVLTLPRNFGGADRKQFCEQLASMPQLSELTLMDGSDAEVEAIAGLKSLRVLNTSPHCGYINEAGIKALGRLDQLESLDINGRIDTDAAENALTKLKHLRELRMDDLSGAPPERLAVIGEFRELRRLHILRYNPSLPLDGVLAYVHTLGKLEELTLRGDMTDKGLESIGRLKKLRRLDLTWARGHTDKGLAALMNALPELRVVKRRYWGKTP